MKVTLLFLGIYTAQYYPGPPMWSRDYCAYNPRDPQCQPPPRPQYNTDPELCIRYGYCLDPMRPMPMPRFEGPPPPPPRYEDDDE